MKNLQPDDLLGNRYSIVENLAQGGFGQTYIAEDRGRPGHPRCVVKQLRPEVNHPRLFETAKRLFLTEAETLEKLGRNEYIPRLLAYFQEEEEFYLVQEFINGETLAHEIEVGQPWPEQDIVAMLESVAKILAFIHQNGVIHRDIKPDNIIRRYADRALVLVDFGTVKQFQNQLAIQGQAAPTVAIGTPGYMPTEQGRGNPRQNSDIYALGMVCIQAATGLNLSQLQEDPQTGELIWHHWAKLSQPLSEILSKMVCYHFKDRYQSAPEVLTALQTAKLIEDVEPHSSETSTASREYPVASPDDKVIAPQQKLKDTSNPILPAASSATEPEELTQQQAVSTSYQTSPSAALPNPTVVDPGIASQPVAKRVPQPTAIASNQPQTEQSSSARPAPQVTSVVSPSAGLAGKGTRPPAHPQPNSSPNSEKASALSNEWIKLSKLAAILGVGSWFLVIILVSFLGTVLLTTGFWIAIVAGLIFVVFAQKSTPLEKILWFAITVISTSIALMAIPKNIAISPLFSISVLGWIAVLILAVLSGAVAFALLTLAEISSL